jgi:hypothetical protein
MTGKKLVISFSVIRPHRQRQVFSPGRVGGEGLPQGLHLGHGRGCYGGVRCGMSQLPAVVREEEPVAEAATADRETVAIPEFIVSKI